MSPKVETLLQYYKHGSYTDHEFVYRLLSTCEPDELKDLPADVETALWRKIEEAPMTDEGWGQMIMIRDWCVPNERVAEKIRQKDAMDLQHFRSVVEALKARKAAK